MRWNQRARIQRVCAALPRGDTLYMLLQRRFGSLSADPFERVSYHGIIQRALTDCGFQMDGARCMEVGTGHIPTLPLLMHLTGAIEVTTVDLHRRLQWDLTGETMAILADSAEDLVATYRGFVEEEHLRDRLRVMGQHAERPEAFFDLAGIRYLAPGDAAAMAAQPASFDLQFSVTVLEHIEPSILRDVLLEARRLLRPGGIAAHVVDLSDHFAHQDPGISRANFLRFSDSRWARIAGNEFGYCNRLRAPELLTLFVECGFEVFEADFTVDERSLAEISDGFPIDGRFAGFSPEDLATSQVNVFAR